MTIDEARYVVEHRRDYDYRTFMYAVEILEDAERQIR